MDTDLTLLRSIVTLVSFATFVGIVLWAYSRSNRTRFDEAAQLPFNERPSAEPRAERRSGESS